MTDGLITAGFQPPFGWESGHLQTIRSRIVRRRRDLEQYGTQRSTLVDLNDGTGDSLVVQLHRARKASGAPGVGTLVLLIHGLGGSAESDYMRATAEGLLAAGFNVARVDLRGVGLSGQTSTSWYHAGRTQDLRAVLTELAREPDASDNRAGQPRLAVVGFSLGGSMTIKMMGEPHDHPPVSAAVAVSAPLDLSVGSGHLHRMAFGVYERFILSGLKKQSLASGPGGLTRLTAQERLAITRARSLADFDDALTAPRNGWRDAAEYYARCSSGPFLTSIESPTLVIHSLDDPMIPASPYRAIDWDTLGSQGFVRRAITARGGHVGFHERGNPLPWYVGQVVSFLSGHVRQ
ncbi:MAG: alpha/beta fold hydrolase [Actinomycetes bacterium]